MPLKKIITTSVNNASNYALIFDGWSEGGIHFIGLFISCPGTEPSAEPLIFLLAFSPLRDETKFTATNHVHFIRSTLEQYNIQEKKVDLLDAQR